MNKKSGPPSLDQMSAPTRPYSHKKKGFWKKPFVLLFGLIGIIASTSTVVGLIKGWFHPDRTQEDLAAIKDVVTAQNEDAHLVNEVSLRVREFKDQYSRIDKNMKDIRRLDQHLSRKTHSASQTIHTLEQKKRQEASRKKEAEELILLLRTTEKMAREFVLSIQADKVLNQVTSAGSQSGQTKSQVQKQAQIVQTKFLPEIKRLISVHFKTMNSD